MACIHATSAADANVESKARPPLRTSGDSPRYIPKQICFDISSPCSPKLEEVGALADIDKGIPLHGTTAPEASEGAASSAWVQADLDGPSAHFDLEGTWWSGLDKMSIISGDTLIRYDGSKAVVSREGDGISIVCNGQRCAARVVAEDRIVWHGGDVWCRKVWTVNGRWITPASGVCIIANNTLTWPNGVQVPIEDEGLTLTIRQFEGTCSATLVNNRLVWDDGDIWRRAPPPSISDTEDVKVTGDCGTACRLVSDCAANEAQDRPMTNVDIQTEIRALRCMFSAKFYQLANDIEAIRESDASLKYEASRFKLDLDHLAADMESLRLSVRTGTSCPVIPAKIPPSIPKGYKTAMRIIQDTLKLHHDCIVDVQQDVAGVRETFGAHCADTSSFRDGMRKSMNMIGETLQSHQDTLHHFKKQQRLDVGRASQFNMSHAHASDTADNPEQASARQVIHAGADHPIPQAHLDGDDDSQDVRSSDTELVRLRHDVGLLHEASSADLVEVLDRVEAQFKTEIGSLLECVAMPPPSSQVSDARERPHHLVPAHSQVPVRESLSPQRRLDLNAISISDRSPSRKSCRSASPWRARRRNGHTSPRRSPIRSHLASPSFVNHALEAPGGTSIAVGAVGDVVAVSHKSVQGRRQGVLRYVGPTQFASGEWYGVELFDNVGRNDGIVRGVRYFSCKPGYGIFVRAPNIRKVMPESGNDSYTGSPCVQAVTLETSEDCRAASPGPEGADSNGMELQKYIQHPIG